jgi:alpha-L-fucosidase
MATSWSYVKTDRYKSVRELVHLLARVVARGGNLLLNVGPSPEGELPPDAYDRLRGLGDWMRVNGEAIYGSRPIAPYTNANVCLTQTPGTGVVHAIVLTEEGERTLPLTLRLPGLQAESGAALSILGVEGTLPWQNEDGDLIVTIPATISAIHRVEHAWTLRISALRRRF